MVKHKLKRKWEVDIAPITQLRAFLEPPRLNFRANELFSSFPGTVRFTRAYYLIAGEKNKAKIIMKKNCMHYVIEKKGSSAQQSEKDFTFAGNFFAERKRR